jgi:hypothetical protein
MLLGRNALCYGVQNQRHSIKIIQGEINKDPMPGVTLPFRNRLTSLELGLV